MCLGPSLERLGSHLSSPFSVLFSAFSFFSCVWHNMKNRAGVLTNGQCHSLFQCVVRHQLPLPTQGAWGGCQRPESSGAAATLTSVRIPQGAHTCPPTPRALPRGVLERFQACWFSPLHSARLPLSRRCRQRQSVSRPVSHSSHTTEGQCGLLPQEGLRLHPVHGHLWDNV